ncbi:MAG: ATP-binding cassette domain-containing protein [Clostridia bacterium]
MLELKNVSVERDNKKILKNINLKIDDNKFIAITGPNGSGKSTLAKVIMGIEKVDSGCIIFDGEDITNFDISHRAKKGIGFAFQQPVKFKGITVRDLLTLSSGKPLKFSQACSYLSDVGLCPRDYMAREINNSLSGGELKRIEIATVAAKKSKFTIFDEPEAGIDLWSFNNLIEVFEKMHNDTFGSIVIISHQEKILNIADKIILLVNGEIKDIGSRDEILPNILNKTKSCRFFKEEANG